MKKRIVISLLIVVGLVMGGALLSQKAYAVSYTYSCVVPYCIMTGDWATGLHITANYYNSEDFEIRFIGSSGHYKTVYLDLADYPGGWTGTVQQLFDLDAPVSPSPEVGAPVPVVFESPSTLLIHSDRGYFMVTQFVMNGATGGFGFQTIYSWPYGSWPHPDVP